MQRIDTEHEWRWVESLSYKLDLYFSFPSQSSKLKHAQKIVDNEKTDLGSHSGSATNLVKSIILFSH